MSYFLYFFLGTNYLRGENRTDILIDNSVKEIISGYTGTSFKDEAESDLLADESRNETMAEENSKIFFVTKTHLT